MVKLLYKRVFRCLSYGKFKEPKKTIRIRVKIAQNTQLRYNYISPKYTQSIIRIKTRMTTFIGKLIDQQSKSNCK